MFVELSEIASTSTCRMGHNEKNAARFRTINHQIVKKLYDLFQSRIAASKCPQLDKVLESSDGDIRTIKEGKVLLANFPSLLRNMARCQQLALNLLLTNHLLQIEKKMHLVLSTFSDDEIKGLKTNSKAWKNLAKYYKAPNSDLVLYSLVEFLDGKGKKLPWAARFLTFARFCRDLMHMVNLSSRIPEQNPLFLEGMKALIREEAQKNDRFLIPGGWLALDGEEVQIGGHFVLYFFEKTTEGFKKVRIDASSSFFEEEEIKTEDLDNTITAILSPQFHDFLKKKVEEMPLDQLKKYLNDIGRNKQDDSSSKATVFVPQCEGFNCCFMAFLLFYQYLCMHDGNKKGRSSVEEARSSAYVFRRQFQEYLECL